MMFKNNGLRLLFVAIFGFVTIQASELEHDTDQISQKINEFLTFQEKVNAIIQNKLIDFNVAHYDTLKALKKTYVDDTAKGDVCVENIFNKFLQTGVLDDMAHFIMQNDKNEYNDIDKEKLFIAIKQYLEKTMFPMMKHQFLLESIIYNRVHSSSSK